MDNVPAEAPTSAPEASVATPNTNQEPAQAPAQPAPDMHGFTSDELGKIRTFLDNNGGFDTIKAKISDPNYGRQAQPQETNPTSQPQSQPQPEAQAQPVYKAPEGSITAQEFLAQQYFQGLSKDPKYEAISAGIASGEYLKEMSAFGIQPLNQDGSINDQKVRMYLDLKAQTVPAKQTGAEPGMSAAPTVDYVQVAGDKIANMEDAYKVLSQDIQLKAMGQSHPLIAQAEEFIKTGGKPVDASKK